MKIVKQVTIKSPAKINLHLDIKEKREDGFHSIISIFQMVSLFDKITISTLRTKNAYFLEGDFGFPVSENIITKAVERFRLVAGISTGIAIKVKKNIPQGAGLGGGSSNAACTLKALNILHNNKLDSKNLFHIAEFLGSDVKFFLRAPTALVTGRGEIIRLLTLKQSFIIILIVPGFSINTKEAYNLFDKNNIHKMKNSSYSPKELEYILNNIAIEKWCFYNSFYDILVKHYPILEIIKRKLIKSGALFTGLTGSGAALFGIFKEKQKTEIIITDLKKKYAHVIKVTPLGYVPTVEWMNNHL